jgi:hypothetical protein
MHTRQGEVLGKMANPLYTTSMVWDDAFPPSQFRLFPNCDVLET